MEKKMSFSTKVKNEIKENKDELATTFIKNGSITDPNNGYHLEFVFASEEESLYIYNKLLSHNLNAKTIKRRKSYVTYIKESEHIADFLNIIGAHSILMDFYNVRILKDISGNINRRVNLEAANLEKTVNAALEQEEDIKFLLNYKTNVLSPELKTLAQTRLENMDATLKELGEKFTPPLTKSCINHRLRKIKKIAETLRNQ